MLAPLKVVGFLLRRGLPAVARSYVRSTGVYSLRVPPGEGEMLRIYQAWFSPDDQQHAHTVNLLPASGLPGGTAKAQLQTCRMRTSMRVVYQKSTVLARGSRNSRRAR